MTPPSVLLLISLVPLSLSRRFPTSTTPRPPLNRNYPNPVQPYGINYNYNPVNYPVAGRIPPDSHPLSYPIPTPPPVSPSGLAYNRFSAQRRINSNSNKIWPPTPPQQTPWGGPGSQFQSLPFFPGDYSEMPELQEGFSGLDRGRRQIPYGAPEDDIDDPYGYGGSGVQGEYTIPQTTTYLSGDDAFPTTLVESEDMIPPGDRYRRNLQGPPSTFDELLGRNPFGGAPRPIGANRFSRSSHRGKSSKGFNKPEPSREEPGLEGGNGGLTNYGPFGYGDQDFTDQMAQELKGQNQEGDQDFFGGGGGRGDVGAEDDGQSGPGEVSMPLVRGGGRMQAPAAGRGRGGHGGGGNRPGGGGQVADSLEQEIVGRANSQNNGRGQGRGQGQGTLGRVGGFPGPKTGGPQRRTGAAGEGWLRNERMGPSTNQGSGGSSQGPKQRGRDHSRLAGKPGFPPKYGDNLEMEGEEPVGGALAMGPGPMRAGEMGLYAPGQYGGVGGGQRGGYYPEASEDEMGPPPQQQQYGPPRRAGGGGRLRGGGGYGGPQPNRRRRSPIFPDTYLNMGPYPLLTPMAVSLPYEQEPRPIYNPGYTRRKRHIGGGSEPEAQVLEDEGYELRLPRRVIRRVIRKPVLASKANRLRKVEALKDKSEEATAEETEVEVEEVETEVEGGTTQAPSGAGAGSGAPASNAGENGEVTTQKTEVVTQDTTSVGTTTTTEEATEEATEEQGTTEASSVTPQEEVTTTEEPTTTSALTVRAVGNSGRVKRGKHN